VSVSMRSKKVDLRRASDGLLLVCQTAIGMGFPRCGPTSRCARFALRSARRKQIVVRFGHSRKLVHQVIRGGRQDVFRTRQSSLEVVLPW
jgi:hypothetical protein